VAFYTRTGYSRIGCDYLRVPSCTFHVVISLGEIVVFHESRESPYPRDRDLIFPNSGPNEEDHTSVKKVLTELKSSIRSVDTARNVG